MLIIGAKGFATEVLDVFHQKKMLNNLAFYDDITMEIGNLLYNTYPILKTENSVIAYFEKHGYDFVIGIGNPILRNKMALKFTRIGGVLKSAISPKATIGSHEVSIGDGVVILSGVNISNNVSIGKGGLIYFNSNITHDAKIGDFVEISPSVNILGRVSVGSFTQLGSNSTILPNIQIGKNVIIGAGSIVTKNIPDNSVAFGVPARIVKKQKPLEF
jgi:sugar O-acyltransferase (sialic acid O-acetyltransferase NeuD family)